LGPTVIPALAKMLYTGPDTLVACNDGKTTGLTMRWTTNTGMPHEIVYPELTSMQIDALVMQREQARQVTTSIA
jgi:hypothetical protein